jgi:hypothetical protein
MKLRFEVDQAECFRNGIDCPKSIVTVQVDPAKLTINERELIAARLSGIDVHKLYPSRDGKPLPFSMRQIQEGNLCHDYPVLRFIMAKAPTLESLMAAIEQDDKIDRAHVIKARRELANPGMGKP